MDALFVSCNLSARATSHQHEHAQKSVISERQMLVSFLMAVWRIGNRRVQH